MECYHSSFAITMAAILTRHNYTFELYLLNPALTLVSGTSLVFHALYKHDPYMSDTFHKALYVVDKGLTHAIGIMIIPPAIRYTVWCSSCRSAVYMAMFWLCYAYVFWVYYVNNTFLYMDDNDWKYWHASIHLVGSVGLVLLHHASLIAMKKIVK